MAQRYVEWYSVHKNSVALRRIALESIRRSSWALNCLAWHEIFRCCDESSSLILRSALHLLIYFKILVFLVVTAAHNYLFIKYSIKLWTKPSITFTMMTSKFETNYSSNTEANPKSGFETVVIANCILDAPLMLLSIIGNALVLVAILRTPSIRSPSVIFLCNLAVSDLLVGLVVQPVYIVEQMVKTVPKLQEAVRGMGFAGCGVSLSTMTAITVDRFLALHYHLQYPNLMTTSRAIYTIITIWCIITLFTFSFIWSPSIYHYFVSAFGITICLLVNLVCFIKIHRIVRRHQLQIRVQQQAVENSTDTNNHHIRQSTRSAKSIFIYFLVMILCYTLLFFVHIISAINNSKSIILCTFPITAAFKNSSINPFLYCWRTPEFRAAVFKTARLLSCREMDWNAST